MLSSKTIFFDGETLYITEDELVKKFDERMAELTDMINDEIIPVTIQDSLELALKGLEAKKRSQCCGFLQYIKNS